jgi:hypothetical protein
MSATGNFLLNETQQNLYMKGDIKMLTLNDILTNFKSKQWTHMLEQVKTPT